MEVIRHQTIREKRHGVAVRRTAHQFDKVLIVLAIREYDLTTVAAVEDVMSESGRNDSSSSRHWLSSIRCSERASRVPLGTVPDLRGKWGQSPICVLGGDSPHAAEGRWEPQRRDGGDLEYRWARPGVRGRSPDLEMLRYRLRPVFLSGPASVRAHHRNE
jgi:hypothetical protein